MKPAEGEVTSTVPNLTFSTHDPSPAAPAPLSVAPSEECQTRVFGPKQDWKSGSCVRSVDLRRAAPSVRSRMLQLSRTAAAEVHQKRGVY